MHPGRMPEVLASNDSVREVPRVSTPALVPAARLLVAIMSVGGGTIKTIAMRDPETRRR
jgi:hypothetical protein